MLGSMFDKNGNAALGWMMHVMMGIVFGIVYALGWSLGIGSVSVAGGALFGALHWLVVGMMMGGMGMMHAGINAGTVQDPGVYMMKNGGMMAFVGGLMGHVLFGLVVALVYGMLA